jgi:hypothetical protein
MFPHKEWRSKHGYKMFLHREWRSKHGYNTRCAFTESGDPNTVITQDVPSQSGKQNTVTIHIQDVPSQRVEIQTRLQYKMFLHREWRSKHG